MIPGWSAGDASMWSVIMAAIGLAASAWVTARLRVGVERPAEVPWLLGLVALLPAWLVNFVGLLAVGDQTAKPVRLAFLASVGLGLLGTILSDALMRRGREAGDGVHAWRAWLLGAVALAPAWLVSLLARGRLAP